MEISKRQGIALLIVSALVLAFISGVSLPSSDGPAGSIDPWVYTGLIMDYRQIMDRFGATYYAARIGHIIPAQLFDLWFGVEVGPRALKIASLWGASAVAAVWAFRSFNSLAVGVFSAILVTATPWLANHDLGDHYDLTTTMYLTIALLISFWPSPPSRARFALAGCFLGLAAHTNAFTLYVYTLALPSIAFVSFSSSNSDRKRLTAVAGFFLFGFLASFVTLELILKLLHDSWGSKGNAGLGVVWWLLSTGAIRNWEVTPSEALAAQSYGFLVPALVGLLSMGICFITTRRTSSDSINRRSVAITVALAWAAILSSAGYLLLAVITRAGILGLSYYQIYLFPSALLAAVSLVWFITSRHTRGTFMVATASAGVILTWFTARSTFTELYGRFLEPTAFGVIAVVLIAICWLVTYSKLQVGSMVLSTVSSVLLLLLPLASVKYGECSGSCVVNRRNLRLSVQEFTMTVNEVSPAKNGRLGFWYDHRSLFANSLQSAFLWGHSRLDPGIDAGAINEENILSYFESNPAGIFVFDSSEDVVDDVTRVFTGVSPKNGRRIDVIQRGTFGVGVGRFYYSFLSLSARTALRVE